MDVDNSKTSEFSSFDNGVYCGVDLGVENFGVLIAPMAEFSQESKPNNSSNGSSFTSIFDGFLLERDDDGLLFLFGDDSPFSFCLFLFAFLVLVLHLDVMRSLFFVSFAAVTLRRRRLFDDDDGIFGLNSVFSCN